MMEFENNIKLMLAEKHLDQNRDGWAEHLQCSNR